ncbi:MAG: hypothetical protein AAF629_31695 [Chloroflexota bacterium]
METKPAYITIVEGPPPEFQATPDQWPYLVLEGPLNTQIAMAEMRTFDGPKLVKRCTDAWSQGRPAKLDFPTGDGERAEIDIVATRWEEVAEGHKLYLWVRFDDEFDFDVDFDDDFDLDLGIDLG